MKSRSAEQLVMDVMPELKDAIHALMLVEHSDGTVSWHGTTDSLNRKLGLLRYVQLLIEQNVQRQPDVMDAESAKDKVH